MSRPQLIILSGYLGSGKTTTLNKLLRQTRELRTLAVINDFGAIEVDAQLLDSPEDSISIASGCICCSPGDDLSRTMTAVARQPVDRVVVEMSGVGDPRQLMPWRTHPGYAAGPVISCVDLSAVPRLLNDRYVADTVHRQLAAAELLVLTHEDRLSPGQRERALQLVDAINPAAAQLVPDELSLWLADPADVAEAGPNPADPLPNHHLTASLVADGPVDLARLQHTLDHAPQTLVRVKGIVEIAPGELVVVERTPAGPVTISPWAGTAAELGLVLIFAGEDAAANLEQLTGELITHHSMRPRGPSPS